MTSSTRNSRNRRLQAARIGAAVLLVLVAAGLLAACGSDDGADAESAAEAPDYSKAIKQAPPELAALYEGEALDDGGIEAYEETLAGLEGHPVVVNKWASWCGPCRVEFPFFQQQMAKRGDEVAFFGINAEDVDAAAETFLRDNPLPYVNFTDPDESMSAELGAAPGIPVTLFYNAEGEKTYTHTGEYSSEDELAADIDKYAING